MRTIVFSDSHICKDSTNEKAIATLCHKITYNKPDLVVMNGDIFDPWLTAWGEINDLPQYELLERMCFNRAKMGLPTIYVKGNHDWVIPSFILPDVIRTAKYEKVVDGKKYIFTHGHQFDFIWGWGPVHDIAFYIEEHAPWTMIPLYNILFRGKLPSQKKASLYGTKRLVEQQTDTEALEEAIDDWSLHYATIQLRAARYAHQKKARITVGHSHCPAPFSGLMADCGDIVDSNTYIDIVNNNVMLKKI